MAFRFRPVDDSFYDQFTALATRLVSGAEVLNQVFAEGADRQSLAEQMREEEHLADEATHDIIRRVNKTFVTPFDREDIYALASALDDVMDFMEEAVDLVVLYEIDRLPDGVELVGEDLRFAYREGHDVLALPESSMRAVRGGRIGMIFQEPATSLNPVMRVGEQIVEAIVAVADDKVAGVALIREKFLLGDYLELLGVAPWARNTGIGGALLAHVERAVFARTKNLFACVSDFNTTARAFYQHQGFQEIGPMPDFLIPGSAEMLLRKTAGPARKGG